MRYESPRCGSYGSFFSSHSFLYAAFCSSVNSATLYNCSWKSPNSAVSAMTLRDMKKGGAVVHQRHVQENTGAAQEIPAMTANFLAAL